MPTLKANEVVNENDSSDFIELKNENIIKGAISNYSLGDYLAKDGGSAVINGKRYKYKEVVAVQYRNKYYRKDTHKGFDERIVKGKINVYRYLEITEEENHTSVFDWYFLQKGDKAPVIEYELKLLEEMVADYQPAVNELNKYKALTKQDRKIKGDQYLNNVISIYNKQ